MSQIDAPQVPAASAMDTSVQVPLSYPSTYSNEPTGFDSAAAVPEEETKKRERSTGATLPEHPGYNPEYNSDYPCPPPWGGNYDGGNYGGGHYGGHWGRGGGHYGRGHYGRGHFGGGYRPNRPFTCANKHPIMALKKLRNDATFELVASYNVPAIGCAHVFTTTIDDVQYQGEGTTANIAKAIAATNALEGIEAEDHEQLQKVADYEEQKALVLERIQAWQELQRARELKNSNKKEAKKFRADARDAAREAKENEYEQANKKKKDNNGTSTPMDTNGNEGFVGIRRDFGRFIVLYGPDVQEVTIELKEKDAFGCYVFKSVLKVQGYEFEATHSSKKGARKKVVDEAFATFDANPPPKVNGRRFKGPRIRRRSGGMFTPIDPVTFQDKLAEKCWNFVSEKIAELGELQPAHIKSRRNLVVIVKVEGEETLENCEIVTFGCGSLLIKKENMTSDGTVIKDCTGESLALRALRRYLLDQIELCLNDKPSVYIQDKSTSKCSLKESVSFCMYTNCSPMGDCRAINHEIDHVKQPMEAESTVVTEETPAADKSAEPPLAGDPSTDVPTPSADAPNPSAEAVSVSPMETDRNKRTGRWGWKRGAHSNFRVHSTPLEELGRITYAKTDDVEGSSEIPIVHDPEQCHCIVSPSDKLAVRQMCGVQGSMLFNLSNPVYISNYVMNRGFDDEALTRALYSRVKGANTQSNVGIEPKFAIVNWKATRARERRTTWAFIWAKDHNMELLFTPEGKRVGKDSLEQTLDAEKMEDRTILVISEYCTKSLYTALSNVCSKNQKPYAQKYSVIKSANTRYRTTKTAVLNHLKDTGMGSWLENSKKAEY